MCEIETGGKVPGFDIARVDRWSDLPLKCNYFTILYLINGRQLYDWEEVDIMWWNGELWGTIYDSW